MKIKVKIKDTGEVKEIILKEYQLYMIKRFRNHEKVDKCIFL